MILRVREHPWRLMLAINLAVLIGVFLYKITREPWVPYIHLLVDYHFGFTKRALIGAIISLFVSKVPVWLVFALSGAVWVITAALFVRVFQRTFGLDERHMPLFVLMAGSPFFLKNFMYTLGHFDIYGCAFALSLLLLPARSIGFVLLAAVASVILILIHHLHFLMYVPTIAAIVLFRYYLVQGFTYWNALIGAVAALAIGALFFAAQFWGVIVVPEAEFVRYLQTRMANPETTRALSFSHIWYQPLSREIQDTWERLPSNLLGFPVFAFLIWLHTPLWRYVAGRVRALLNQTHRRVVIAAICAVSVGYLLIFVTVFDYSRWVSNWAVCMFLILLALKNLPGKPVTLIGLDDRNATILGWVMTVIPRVGIVRPF